MKITALVRGKKSNRINVFVDEKYSFSVEEITLTKFNLFKGRELTEVEIEKITSRDLIEKFTFKAINLIGRRPRSIREVKDYLKRKLSDKRYFELDKEKITNIVEQIVSRLIEKNYLNDQEFARWWVKGRMEFSPRGEQALRNELFVKGVEKETIDEALRENVSKEKQNESAVLLTNKKYVLLKSRKLDNGELKNKLSRYLLSRGYSWETITYALKQIVD